MKKTITRSFVLIAVAIISIIFTACGRTASTSTDVDLIGQEPVTEIATTNVTEPEALTNNPDGASVVTLLYTHPTNEPQMTEREKLYRDLMQERYFNEEGLKPLQEFLSENKPDGYDNINGYMSPYWNLDNSKKLFIEEKTRKPVIYEGKWQYPLPMGYFNTADYNGNWQESYITWTKSTWVSNDNGISEWILGNETKHISEDFAYPKFEGWHSVQKVIWLSSETTFGYFDVENQEFVVLANDYAGKYDAFCNSVYYINTNNQLCTVNFLTHENTILLESVYDIGGSDWIWAKTKDGTTEVPYFVDWNGQQQKFFE